MEEKQNVVRHVCRYITGGGGGSVSAAAGR